MTALLAKRARSKERELRLEPAPGQTVGSLLDAEGFSGTDAEAITALVNGEQSGHDRALADGDEVELLVGIAGGSTSPM